ncbi:MAG: DUF6569 family protein [Saprospiraceae bacterium]|nr:hypothetical protein [Saprospiraceae bacterium]MCB9344146.1 hypothetical protein [Lewinellaceae bacterium]
MKKFSLLAALVLFIFSCQNESISNVNINKSEENQLSINMDPNAEWQYKNLRLYPVTSNAVFANSAIQHLKTLSEAMQTPGFRVLERKQFGRGNEPWYNGLTVQNKTQDTVLLMAGDVVTGGNQDRVMAHHEVVLPGTVKNVEVFCVEAGRSTYYNQSASQAEKSVGAFRGYYNVASPQVRHAVHTTGEQEDVWAAVARVTEANGANSDTKAYAALEKANEQKAKRDAYLSFFEDKFSDDPTVVGVVAVSGDKVLGIDVLGDHDLFQRQFPHLVHGYVAEAAILESVASLSEAEIQRAFKSVAKLRNQDEKPTDTAGRFALGNDWVHLYKK